jgi:hypothetical protein
MSIIDRIADWYDDKRDAWEDRKYRTNDSSNRFRRFIPSIGIRGAAVIPVAVVLFLALIYYPVFGWLRADNIFDDVNAPVSEQFRDGASETVKQMLTMADREVNDHVWVPNRTMFSPTIFLDNTPNYQISIIDAISRMSESLRDDIGRTRGSGGEDRDLEEATGRFKMAPDVWVWDPSVSIIPQASSPTQYQYGIEKLENYNRRLAAGQAIFDARPDNLMAALNRIAKDLGSESDNIEKMTENSIPFGWFDTKADDLYFNVKGKLYAYCMIVKGLGVDFEHAIQLKSAGTVWAEMQNNLCTAAEFDPWIISNSSPEDWAAPSHLSSLGFRLLRARTKLTEVRDILDK